MSPLSETHHGPIGPFAASNRASHFDLDAEDEDVRTATERRQE